MSQQKEDKMTETKVKSEEEKEIEKQIADSDAKLKEAEAETKESLKKIQEAEKALEEQIEVFEPIAQAVDRVLSYGGQTRKYVQHEMGFLTKLKFFRLLSQTIRMASEDVEGGTSAFLDELFSSAAQEDTESTNAIFGGILRLVELSPDFIEEAYMYALSVPPEDRAWAQLALENLTDDEGLDILEVFVAQNGESIRDFFMKRLRKIGKRLGQVMNQGDQQAP